MNSPNLPDPFGDTPGSPAHESLPADQGGPGAVPAWSVPEQPLPQQSAYPVVPAGEPGLPAQGAPPSPGTPGGFGLQRADRLTAGEVRSVAFARASLGRRGLDEDHVRAFLLRVENELVQLGNEKAALAEEVAQLRERLGSAGPDGRGGMAHEEAHFQAVRILSSAQQTADLYVADAERYTRELAHEARLHREAILSDARGRAELMLEEAQQRAADVAERAARSAAAAEQALHDQALREQSPHDRPGPSSGTAMEPVGQGAHLTQTSLSADERQSMEREIAYLRTYSDVYRTHLRSYLEALLRNVDEWENSERAALPDRP
ncbi:DivIVA domain-containing protein [Spirillospora sp. NPDC047279]|uniref:DivIVA domain-containing protein n=1 Tax=Spirillospora sp. NPDC047279 TaxID=3155478 RepID=UPI0034052F4B